MNCPIIAINETITGTHNSAPNIIDNHKHNGDNIDNMNLNLKTCSI